MLAGLALTVPVMPGPAWAGSVIDTMPYLSSWVEPLGEDGDIAFGQTFRTPNTRDTRLDYFAFRARPIFGTTYYRAYVYEWNESLGQLQGDALYISQIKSMTAGLPFEQPRLLTGGVELAPDRDYVALLSSTGLFDGVPDRMRWRTAQDTEHYPSGHFVFHYGNGVFPSPGITWECGRNCDFLRPGDDVAFKMGFNTSPIPEPSVSVLMLAGFGLLRLKARRDARATVR